MFDLRGEVNYLAPRVGMTTGRIWFGAGNAVNATLTAKQRHNFLRFLNRHELRRFLVLDDFHKKQSASIARVPMDFLEEWKAQMLNRLFQRPGVLKERARINLLGKTTKTDADCTAYEAKHLHSDFLRVRRPVLCPLEQLCVSEPMHQVRRASLMIGNTKLQLDRRIHPAKRVSGSTRAGVTSITDVDSKLCYVRMAAGRSHPARRSPRQIQIGNLAGVIPESSRRFIFLALGCVGA